MKELEKILDIDPADIQLANPPEVKPKDSDEPEDVDFDYIRTNYYALIQQGSIAMNGALRVALESENPRAFEVVAVLMKNLADVNRQLLMTGEDKQKVKLARKGSGTAAPVQQVTNNTAVFMGSSAELQKLLKQSQ
jgi:hypothetical protein